MSRFDDLDDFEDTCIGCGGLLRDNEFSKDGFCCGECMDFCQMVSIFPPGCAHQDLFRVAVIPLPP